MRVQIKVGRTSQNVDLSEKWFRCNTNPQASETDGGGNTFFETKWGEVMVLERLQV